MSRKMRLHILIAMAVFLGLFIAGSFVDLQLSEKIFIKDHWFGIAVAALSMNVGYAVLAFMGGIVLFHAIKFSKVNWQKAVVYLLSAAFLGAAIFFDGKEFFGENGWYGVVPEWVGYLVALPLMGGCYYVGYILGKKANNPRLLYLMIVGAIFIGLSLIIGTTVVKNIFHRPRYRLAVHDGYVGFHAWWERCSNYQDIMKSSGLFKEEFRSFPSGHTSVCALPMLFIVILPFILGKEVKFQVIYFYLALLYALFVAYTRVVVGAHFLSDVGMGGLLTTTCLYIYYEIIIHKPEIYQVPEAKVEENN